MNILAIDPGTTESGWVLFSDGKVTASGIDGNEMMLAIVDGNHADLLAIEKIEAMGMAVGKEVFETVHWSGRFYQAWRDPSKVERVTRRAVKLHLCGSMKAKDANIRQALIDMLGPQGNKKTPGPTYGVRGHEWSALAVAVTAAAMLARARPCAAVTVREIGEAA